MECTFQVEQKVICVKNMWFIEGPHYGDFYPPAKGVIYTVRAVGVPTELGIPVAFVCLRLKELPEKNWYKAGGFRPLQDRPKEADTDISVFYPSLTVTGPWGAPEPTAPTPAPARTPELEPVP